MYDGVREVVEDGGVEEAVDFGEEPDGFAERGVPVCEYGFRVEEVVGGGGVYYYWSKRKGRGGALSGGFFGRGFDLSTAFGGVVEVAGLRDKVFDFGADYGLRAEDETGLGILEDALDELAEVEVGAVVGINFSC